jgi:hypothetical protein
MIVKTPTAAARFNIARQGTKKGQWRASYPSAEPAATMM